MSRKSGGGVHQSNSVLIAHPYALLRQTISSLLSEAGFKIVAQARTEAELIRMAEKHKPDMMLLDWRISADYLGMVRRLTEQIPGLIIVILTQPQSSEVFLHILKAGARGYLSLDISPDDFISSLALIARGNIVVSSDLVSILRQTLIGNLRLYSGDNLSEREQEVLRLIVKGDTNREVASKLYISEHTVKVHLRSVLNKLGLRNRQQAAAYASRKGMVDNGDLVKQQ
ncbi:MAG: response regulator transcription factor [Dehalococcoidia bacterium]|nr:response regulator transcription factor [Dehalococcoidia bacterium]